MSTERVNGEVEEFCVRCGRQMVVYHANNAFYICEGVPREPGEDDGKHPPMLVSTKLVQGSENGSSETVVSSSITSEEENKANI